MSSPEVANGIKTTPDDVALGNAYAIIGEQTVRIKRLEAQNAKLRSRVSFEAGGLQPDTTEPAPPAPTQPGASEVSSDDDIRVIASDHARLLVKYRALKARQSECETTVRDALAKASKYKKWAQEWCEFLKINFPNLWLSNPPSSSDGLPRTGVVPHENRQPSDSSEVAEHPASGNDESRIQSEPRVSDASPSPEAPEPTLNASQVQKPSTGAISRITSSQTTVFEELEDRRMLDVPIKSEASSDSEPFVVSARSLKRKGRDDGNDDRPAVRIKQEPNSQINPIELRSEEGSGLTTPPAGLDRVDTLDLDNIGPVVITPRRPRVIDRPRHRANSVGPTVQGPPQLLTNVSSMSDGHFELAVTGNLSTEENLLRSLVSNAPKRLTTAVPRPTHESPSRHGTDQSRVLQPISANISRRSGGQAQSKSRRASGKTNLRILSEDGDDPDEQCETPHREQPKQSKPWSPMSRQRQLEALLHEPPPERTDQPRRVKLESTKTKSKDIRSPRVKTPLPAIKRSPASRPKIVLKRPRGLERSPPPVRPEEEPLRLRPVTSLRLHDFKINSKYMGTDFAFADTIRGKEQRRALHVCMRPECCGGALSKVIEMGGTSLSGKTDAQALEAYLGPDWENIVTGYGPEKRREIATQAHAFSFANQHGKHRRAFERPASPPGFWRMDMPSTQEAEEDRRQAQEMERVGVEERWREAMRQGGRYVFRDE